MGIFNGRDVFTSKYTTAQIAHNGRLYVNPIKFTIDDMFIAKIENEIFVFKVEPIRELTYTHKGVKHYKTIWYTTKHIMPVSPENNRLLEQFLYDNALPRVNNMLFSTLKFLGKREKPDAKPLYKIPDPNHKEDTARAKDSVVHDLDEMFKLLEKEAPRYKQQVDNLREYFKTLGVKEIVTPTKMLSEFLEDDLFTIPASFFGGIKTHLESLDPLHKKLTNQPKTGKDPWIKLIVIVVAIAAGAGLIIWLASSGAFSHILPQLPSIGTPPGSPAATGGKLSMDQIGKDYPTIKSLLDAVTSKAVACSQLPADAIHGINTPALGGAAGTCPG